MSKHSASIEINGKKTCYEFPDERDLKFAIAMLYGTLSTLSARADHDAHTKAFAAGRGKTFSLRATTGCGGRFYCEVPGLDDATYTATLAIFAGVMLIFDQFKV